MSENRRRIEEILNELSVDDVLLMAEIVSMYVERVYRARARLQRAMSIMGVTRATSETTAIYEMIMPVIREEIAKRLGGAPTPVTEEEREVDEATYRKLRSVLERVKQIEKKEEQGKK